MTFLYCYWHGDHKKIFVLLIFYWHNLMHNKPIMKKFQNKTLCFSNWSSEKHFSLIFLVECWFFSGLVIMLICMYVDLYRLQLQNYLFLFIFNHKGCVHGQDLRAIQCLNRQSHRAPSEEKKHLLCSNIFDHPTPNVFSVWLKQKKCRICCSNTSGWNCMLLLKYNHFKPCIEISCKFKI